MKKKNKWSTFALLLLFFIGLSVMLYPSLSNFWNSRTQSKAIDDYEGSLANIPKEDFDKYIQRADEYNRELSKLGYPLLEYSSTVGYESFLDITGNNMIGVVNISKIGIELPLYHGTSDDVLAVAIGHLEGSSLPVGGENTHTVLSAHRGLPTARLFTDLDKMEVGDTFTISVLDRVLTYEVDQIRIVQPNDTSLLNIAQGEDYCTLLTCTPYGINTERLLVRGVRTENVDNKVVKIVSDATQIDILIVTPIVALPMLFVMMMIVLFKPVKKEQIGEIYDDKIKKK